MDADQTTTDESEHSGTDDSPYNSDNESRSEDEEPGELETIASEDFVQDMVKQLLSKGYKGPKILEILLVRHNISLSASSLTRYRKLWGLRHCDIPQPTQVELSPQIRASIMSSHSKGLNLQEIQARLAKETGITVHLRTVKRYLRRLRLKLNVNDLTEGNVTLSQVYEAIDHIQRYLLHNNTGYRQMKTLLMRNYNIRIP
ncbi:hypothetical protein PTTG_30409, partial [Puccinia triticina 1-1 BBBD Race 1]